MEKYPNDDILEKNNYKIDSNNNFKSNPLGITLTKIITKISYTSWFIDRTFVTFETKNGDYLLVYSTENISLICYDLLNEKSITTILKAHRQKITSILYYVDSKHSKNIVITGSDLDCCVKMWNISIWNCELLIDHTHEIGSLCSLSILYNNNQNIKEDYLITSSKDGSERIKVWNFKGKLIKEINESKDTGTLFIDNFYDKNNLKKNYIISGNSEYFKSFDFVENILYHKYHDENSVSWHCCGLVKYNSRDKILELIDSGHDGFIRFWNFHTSELLRNIYLDTWLIGICLWNEKYLFVGCTDHFIRLIDLQKKECVYRYTYHNDRVCSIKAINHPKYGECLLSQGRNKDGIVLWAIKKK